MLLPDYRRLLDALGYIRAVLMQPSFYATENAALLLTMDTAGWVFHGVAMIGDDVTTSDPEVLHAAGVRSARFNILDRHDGRGPLPLEPLARPLAMLAAGTVITNVITYANAAVAGTRLADEKLANEFYIAETQPRPASWIDTFQGLTRHTGRTQRVRPCLA